MAGVTDLIHSITEVSSLESLTRVGVCHFMVSTLKLLSVSYIPGINTMEETLILILLCLYPFYIPRANVMSLY